MNIRFQRIIRWFAALLVLMIAGCTAFGFPLSAEEQQKIDKQIREEIEKTFPLPEQVVIKTHVGDDLTFSTPLNLDEVVTFYQDAYSQKGYEEKGSQVSADSATLLFQKAGEKTVTLEVTKNKKDCAVHLYQKSSTP